MKRPLGFGMLLLLLVVAARTSLEETPKQNRQQDNVPQTESPVGGGTLNPSSKLEVNGNLKIVGTSGRSGPGGHLIFEGNRAAHIWLDDQLDGETPKQSDLYFAVQSSAKAFNFGHSQGNYNTGSFENWLTINSGNVGIGTPSPEATLDVNGPIFQRGVQLYADYVFDPDYELESIEAHAAYMWEHQHLKAIPKAVVDAEGREILDVGAHRRGLVEELEKAHIYIEQLHRRLKQQQREIDALKHSQKVVEQLRADVENLKTQMARLESTYTGTAD